MGSSDKHDVAMAVRNLRSASPPPPPPKSANRLRANTSPPDSGGLAPALAPSRDGSGQAGVGSSASTSAMVFREEERTLRMIKQALEKSDDDGDTLDLSRRDIDRIGEEAVEMFKNGVGKGQKGVWRCVRSS